MELKQVLEALKKAGNETARKTYLRHGAGEDVYGVRFADLKVIAKKIGTDHDLALALRDSGNFDARLLASMVCDPAQLTVGLVETWIAEIGSYVFEMTMAAPISRAPFAQEKMTAWMADAREYVRAMGYDVLSQLIRDGHTFSDTELLNILKTIEADIHASPNRARYAMNGALIGIGGINETLKKAAIEAAQRIGKVEVDHGDTSCKTPDAVPYIEKMWARRR